MIDEQRKKMTWFKFFPADWFEVLMMENEEAGARFKQMLVRLGKNEAPEDSIESKMIGDARKFHEAQLAKIMKRWNKDAEPIPEQTQEPVRPKVKEPQKLKPPALSEVYDFCDSNKIIPTLGREWYEWQCNKGWNNIKTQWQVAFKVFASKHK